MDLGAALQVAAWWLGGLLMGGLGLSLLVGRLLSITGRQSLADSERRRRQWEREARLERILPGTLPLEQIPRARPDALDPAFSEPDMLAWAQRAWSGVHLALARGATPPLPISGGAVEALRAGPRVGTLREAMPGRAELRATDRGPTWCTVDLALCGLLVEQREGVPLPWRVEETWRLRCDGAARLGDIEAAGWELLAVLDQGRVRYDLLPCALEDWGGGQLPAPSGGALAEERARLLVDLPPELADLEGWARRLVGEVLTGELARVGEPLLTACAADRAFDALCGRIRRLGDLRLGRVVVTELRAHPRGRCWAAVVEVEARRVVWDAAGAVVAGDPERVEAGVLALRAREVDAGWVLWDLRPRRA